MLVNCLLLVLASLLLESTATSIWTTKRAVVEEAPLPYNWFQQPLDHFDPKNTNSWSQKYLVNDEYWGGAGSPIFRM
jgi:hypothetical protein